MKKVKCAEATQAMGFSAIAFIVSLACFFTLIFGFAPYGFVHERAQDVVERELRELRNDIRRDRIEALRRYR